MATLKKQSYQLAKRIRKATGLKLPIAMLAGKFITRGRGYELRLHPATQEFVKSIMFCCGEECCGWKGFALVGPKGEYNI